MIGVPRKVVYLHYTTAYIVLCLPLCHARCLSFQFKLGRMATLLGKSYSFCSSCVLSEKCFVVFYVFSFPPGVFLFGTLNLIALITGPSILFLFYGYSKLSSSGSLFFRSGFQIIAHSKLGFDLTIRKYNPSSK